MKKQNDSKKILLTFDYELFMGAISGTVENCLLKPTNEILSILKKNNSKAIFFVDTTFLNLLSIDSPEIFFLVKEQIQRMCLEGHLVELHLHPQWLDAFKSNDNQWKFKPELKYRLDLFSEKQIEALFQSSFEILKGILSEVNPKYKITAFRAGGWCLPEFKIVEPIFRQLGLVYDLSVLPGSYADNGIYQKYDYRLAPKEKACWSFAQDVCRPEAGPFVEVPCTMVKFNRVNLIQNRLFMRNQKISGDGAGAVYRKNFIQKIINIVSNPYKPLTLDGYNYLILNKAIKNTKQHIVTLVGHPKSFGSLNMQALDKLTEEYETILLQDLKV